MCYPVVSMEPSMNYNWYWKITVNKFHTRNLFTVKWRHFLGVMALLFAKMSKELNIKRQSRCGKKLNKMKIVWFCLVHAWKNSWRKTLREFSRNENSIERFEKFFWWEKENEKEGKEEEDDDVQLKSLEWNLFVVWITVRGWKRD